MASILQVLSASGKTTVQDEYGNHDVRYLTLGDKKPVSGNRYYVSLSGKDADVELKEGDRIMLELCFCAYKINGRWHMSNNRNCIKFIEMGNCNDYEKKEK